MVNGRVLESFRIKSVSHGQTRQAGVRQLPGEQRAADLGAVVVPASQILVEVTHDDQRRPGVSVAHRLDGYGSSWLDRSRDLRTLEELDQAAAAGEKTCPPGSSTCR